MTEQTKVEWPTCGYDVCIGIRLASARMCLAHASEEETAAALKLVSETGEIDARGVPITSALLERIFAAAPPGENAEPLIKGCRFDWATFQRDAGFGGTTFTGDAWFREATFTGDAGFGGATFTGDAGFGGATFTGDADFSRAIFKRDAGFGGATFTGDARFGEATFEEGAGFGGAAFTGYAGFGEATFTGRAGFERATFTGLAVFIGATFNRVAGFTEATFSDHAEFGAVAEFDGATFDQADFHGTTFSRDAGFGGATFGREAWFGAATFTGDARFEEATFTSRAGFEEATFTGRAGFIEATFNHDAVFTGATFTDALFGKTIFTGLAWFDGATFGGVAGFTESTFTEVAAFDGATFTEVAAFDGAIFKHHAGFRGATFTGRAMFRGATFSRDARFTGATFSRDAWFDRATLTGNAEFRGTIFKRTAEFGGARFEQAGQFGPLLVYRELVLDDVQFAQPVQIEVSSSGVCCRRARFPGGVQFRLRWARVVLDDTELAAPSILAGIPRLSSEALARPEEQVAKAWRRRPAGRPQLMSLRRANVAGLGLSTVSAADCRFAGAHNLDKLRLESDVSFAESRSLLVWRGGWTWGGRQVIAEERTWRARPDRFGHRLWMAPRWPIWLNEDRPGMLDPGQIAGLYRALRKGREDAKDEPGAADFYYGEMEMRRLARRSVHTVGGTRIGKAARGRVERWILTAYWLVSGYGLRAWRAVAWLAVVTALLAVAFHLAGFAVPPRPVSYWTSLLYAFRSTLSLTDNQVTLTAWGQLLQAVLRLTGPVLLGLALLALRGRVKR